MCTLCRSSAGLRFSLGERTQFGYGKGTVGFSLQDIMKVFVNVAVTLWMLVYEQGRNFTNLPCEN